MIGIQKSDGNKNWENGHECVTGYLLNVEPVCMPQNNIRTPVNVRPKIAPVRPKFVMTDPRVRLSFSPPDIVLSRASAVVRVISRTWQVSKENRFCSTVKFKLFVFTLGTTIAL